MAQENAIDVTEKAIYNLYFHLKNIIIMTKKVTFLLFAFIMLIVGKVHAEDVITDNSAQTVEESVDFTEITTSAPVEDSNKYFKKNWKKLCANSDDLTTEEAQALKDWLYNKGKKQRKKGTWMMLTSIPLGIIAPALVCGALKNGDKNENSGARTAIAIAGFSWFMYGGIGGFINYSDGTEKRDQSRLIIVSIPIEHEFHFKNFMASTGLRLINTSTNRYTIGAGVTFTF